MAERQKHKPNHANWFKASNQLRHTLYSTYIALVRAHHIVKPQVKPQVGMTGEHTTPQEEGRAESNGKGYENKILLKGEVGELVAVYPRGGWITWSTLFS